MGAGTGPYTDDVFRQQDFLVGAHVEKRLAACEQLGCNAADRPHVALEGE